jgi:hypothetical protein
MKRRCPSCGQKAIRLGKAASGRAPFECPNCGARVYQPQAWMSGWINAAGMTLSPIIALVASAYAESWWLGGAAFIATFAVAYYVPEWIWPLRTIGPVDERRSLNPSA